jgi:steroid 5-alpha reductase family enzyme
MLLNDPFWSTILLVFIIIAGIQFVAYVFSAILKTEKFYDLSGAATYFTAILVSLLVRNDSIHPRQIIVSVLGLVWCSRLGIFLFMRVLRVEDKRFADLKTNFVRFSVPWALQILWVFFTALGIYVVNANPGNQRGIQWSDYIGIAIWAFGFAVEATADHQKNTFKNKHPKDFITTGLWKYSRYPNYFGEVTLWYGMFIICAASFEPWQWVTIISPLFVTALLVFGSGVALSEKGAEQRYGAREDYQDYKQRTSKFFLWFPKERTRVDPQ